MSLREKIKYFIRGAGSAINMFPTQKRLGDYFPHYNEGSPQEQDAQALASDWRMVGKDLENSIKKLETEVII